MILISHSLGYLKTVIMAAVSWLAGSTVGIILQIQPAAEPPWYQHPAVVSALVTALFLFGMKLLDHYRDGKKDEQTQKEKEKDQHQTQSEKLQELTQEERTELLGELKGLHQREIEFLKYQAEFKKIEAYEARLRAHAFGNELNRIHLHVYKCHTLMSQNSVEIPDFALKSYEEMMLGIDSEVAEYKQKLEKEKDAIVHLTEG